MQSIIQKIGMVMAMLCLFLNASAYDFEIDGLYYEVNLENMTATLVAGENKQSGEIVIPASVSYKGREFSVTSIKGAFLDNRELIKVILPQSIESLGDRAFKGCSSLQGISGLNNITELGIACFESCTSLTIIDLPEGLKKIGSYAFAGCEGLSAISIPNAVSSIGSYAFSDCSSLSYIQLPSMITELSQGLFEGCSSLDNLEIPHSIVTIKDNVFAGCKEMSSIIIPTNLQQIGNGVFNGCISLTQISIEATSSQLSVGYSKANGDIRTPLFEDCPLSSVIMGRNIISSSKDFLRKYGCFCGNTSLTEVVIGENVSYIEQSAFENCSNLKSISIPRSVVSIGGWAFASSGLEKVIFEDGFDALYLSLFSSSEKYKTPNTFSNCNIESVYLGRTLEVGSWQEWNFGYSSTTLFPTTLKQIIIGDYVNNIDMLLMNNQKVTSSLSHYPNLVTAQFGVNLQQLPSMADNELLEKLSSSSMVPPTAKPFTNSQYMDLNVEIPIGSLNAYQKAPIWKNFWNFNEQADLLTLFEIDGLWYHVLTENTVEVVSNNNPYVGDIIIPEKVVYQSSQFDVVSIGDVFSENRNISSIILPNTIKNLSKGCFQDCVKLSSVTLGNEILGIPDECFKNCLLLSIVVLPGKLETIGKNAFEGCQSLNSISFPDCLKRLETGAFINCGGLSEISLPQHIDYMGTSVFMGCSNLQLVNWSRNMYSINDYTFKDCASLNNINSLNNIIKIGQEAFRNCSSLQSINLGEEILTIGNFAFANSGIKDFVVAKSVESIESDAFSNCASLTLLTFVESERPIVLGYNSARHLSNSITPFPNPSDVDERRTGFINGYYNGLFYGLPIERLVINRNIELPKYYERTRGSSTSSYSTVYHDIVYYPPFYGLTNLKYLEIGENVSAICKNQIEAVVNAMPTTMEYTNFGQCDNIEVVVSNNPNAPIGGGFSKSVYKNASLFLPNGGIDSYKSDDYWKNFAHINEASFIPIESISFESDEVVIDVNESKKLNPIFNPSEASIKNLNWSSSNPQIINVSRDGVITSSSWDGESIITATTCDGTNLSASIKIIVQEGAGISDVVAERNIDISIKENDCILISGKSETDIVEIFNIQGQLITTSTSNIIAINSKGVYLVKIGSVCKKIIL